KITNIGGDVLHHTAFDGDDDPRHDAGVIHIVGDPLCLVTTGVFSRHVLLQVDVEDDERRKLSGSAVTCLFGVVLTSVNYEPRHSMHDANFARCVHSPTFRFTLMFHPASTAP